MICFFMKNNVYLPSAKRCSAVIKSEMLHKSNGSNVYWKRNIRYSAVCFSKASQEPWRNSSLLIGTNRRDATNTTGCTQLFCASMFSEARWCYMILKTRNRTQMNLKSHPVKPSPLCCVIMIQFCWSGNTELT